MNQEQAGDSAAPEHIDAYRIVRRIGAGGMGTVYEAEQDEPRRRVALKILRADADPDVLRRFELEAEVLGSLHHPGIAQVYALGRFRSPGGTLPYLALEYIHGVTLNEFVEREGLDQRQRMELLVEVCSAVQHAHQHGVIHRDLKPANILVEEDGRPKVLDFGVSRVVREGQPARTALTQTGHLLGTLAYMSPEQARGERTIDTRTDVYSLGVIAFELLSGRWPHEVAKLPVLEALQTIQEKTAPRLETVDPSLRGDLSIIVAKALAPEPERRYASAAAFGDELTRYLTDQPITARPPTLAYQLSRFVRRNKALVASVAVAFVGLVVGLILALVARAEEAHQRSLAEQRTVEAQQAAYAATVQAAMVYGSSGDVHSAQRRLQATPPERRSWEWDYLAAALEDEFAYYAMDLQLGPGPAVSPDRGHALFAVDRETLRLFDLAAETWTDYAVGQPLPSAIALLDDQRSFLASDRGRIQLRDLRGERAPRPICTTGDDVRFIEAAPDGRHAVVFSLAQKADGHPVCILDLESLAVVRRLKGFPWLACANLSPDASLLVGGAREGAVLVADVATGQRRHTFEGHTIWPSSTLFSPSGRRLASSGADGTIRLWSLPDGRQERVLGPFQDVPSAIAFHADDHTLFSGHQGGRIRRWNLETGACEWMTAGSKSRPNLAKVMRVVVRDDRVYAIAHDGVHVRPAREPLTSVLYHRGSRSPYVYDAEFSPGGRHLASSGWDGKVRIWDTATRRLVAALDCPANAFWAHYSPDGRRLLVCAQRWYSAHTILLWDLATLTELGTLDIRTNTPCALFVPHSGRIVLGVDTQLWVADPDTLEVHDKRGMPERVSSLALSADGRRIAAGLSDGRCVVLDAEGLRTIHELQAHEAAIEAVRFSPDSRRLATGAGDATIRVWDVESGRERLRIDTPEGREFFALRFTSDGRRILSGSRYATIRIWDADSGREVLQLRGHASYVHGLDFSPDGRILASASGDNSVRLWDARPLNERVRERDRVLAAERNVRGRVAEMFDELQTLGKVVAAIDADSALDPLEKHAARNVAYRFQGQG